MDRKTALSQLTDTLKYLVEDTYQEGYKTGYQDCVKDMEESDRKKTLEINILTQENRKLQDEIDTLLEAGTHLATKLKNLKVKP